MIISLDEAKNYLRVDSEAEDITIENLMKSAQNLCMDVARIDDESDFDSAGDAAKIAVLHTLGFFYENRGDENSDLHALILRLRSLLFGLRKEKF